ncbi:MAG: hypothetical protein ACLU3I_04455 [Acutalibacteraceae bacterium]
MRRVASDVLSRPVARRKKYHARPAAPVARRGRPKQTAEAMRKNVYLPLEDDALITLDRLWEQMVEKELRKRSRRRSRRCRKRTGRSFTGSMT